MPNRLRRHAGSRTPTAGDVLWAVDWASFRHYAERERGVVLVNELQQAEMKVREIA